MTVAFIYHNIYIYIYIYLHILEGNTEMNEVLRYNWNLNWVFMKCIIACVQFHFSEHTVMQMFCDLLDF